MLTKAEVPANAAELYSRLRRILVTTINADPTTLTPGSVIADISTDSVDTITLTMAIEDEFDIEVPDDVLDRLRTVQDVTGYLIDRLGIEG